MALAEYKKKRRFGSTPEPASGKVTNGKTLRFVVQKHDARNLHYDFRLENGGVLNSWAVPKGPSLNPNDKRLAMRTEDHPYDYQYFEGVIPPGNYGAGQVIVWDAGSYKGLEGKSKSEQEKALRRGLRQGKISFNLYGQKLKGEFALVKTDRKGQDNAWLLLKKKDKFSKNSDVTENDKSVISGRRVGEVGASNLDPNEWREVVETYNLPKEDLKRPLEPMLATLTDAPFSDDGWLYEIKWDGYRAVAEIANGRVKLYSRNGEDFTKLYPEVTAELATLSHDMVVDGEIVCLDQEGKPDFGALQTYDPKQDSSPIYHLFDLVWLDGYNLSSLPLEARKSVLQKVMPDLPLLRFSDHIVGRGEDFFKSATGQNLEGVMAKKRDSEYLPGRRVKTWLKIKTVLRQEAVIGGFTEPRGGRQGLGALLLGVYENGKLTYIGHSGTGLTDQQLTETRNKLEKIERDTAPFETQPKPNAPVHWVEPQLVAEISFSEWTRSGHMRHPKIIGLRSDKPVKEVTRERPVSRPAGNNDRNPKLGFEFTNLDKIFWSKQRITKGDLVGYYQKWAGLILPYLKDRPMTMLRHPNGVEGSSFFQKDIDPSQLPNGLETYQRFSESNQKQINYLVCTSEKALLYMVQLGCIEMNPWNSQINNIGRPDWLVLDLDPEAIGFGEVIKVALEADKLLTDLGIKSFPKTSGKTGIHIYLPLAAKYDYDQTRQFAELLARNISSRLPKITSVERSPAKRQGRVYIDFLQNRIGQTLAAPYSIRPTQDATVSMPLSWGQVDKNLKPTDFTMKNFAEIIENRSDPWSDFWQTETDIKAALRKL